MSLVSNITFYFLFMLHVRDLLLPSFSSSCSLSLHLLNTNNKSRHYETGLMRSSALPMWRSPLFTNQASVQCVFVHFWRRELIPSNAKGIYSSTPLEEETTDDSSSLRVVRRPTPRLFIPFFSLLCLVFHPLFHTLF